jgi:zinc-ribbon domain
MLCPACHKTLPTNVRFCAYCGTDLGWRLLPGLSLPRVQLPPRWQVSGALAAMVGGLSGALIALPFSSILPGAFVGGLGLGASAMFAEVVTAAIPDRRAAERFGQALGALGGALVLPGGLLTGLIITVWSGGPHSLQTMGALLVAGFYLGLICAAGGALIGAAGGVIVGGYTGRFGHALLRRRGAILGAASAWTAATVLGGLFAGDFAGRISGATGPASATFGVILQVLVGASLLPLVRRVQRRWQGWLTGRP